jgi:ABC-type branched-subunit amino acid transport system substrate-binding protein
MKWIVHSLAASAMLACASGAWAQKGETVKIGWIDPLSGLMAAVGTNQLKTFQLMAEDFNRKNASGVKFEIIPLDNKLSPQETTAVMRWKSTTRATRARKSSTSTTRPWTRTSPTASAATGTSAWTPTPP